MSDLSWDASHLRTFLIAAGGDQLHALFLVMGMTGLQLDEALTLCWSDVDLDAGTVRIDQRLGQVDCQPASTPERGHGRPEVELDAGTAELLRWHGCWQRLQKLRSDSWPDTGFVFTTPDGSCLSAAQATGHFHRLITAIGLPAIQVEDLPRVRAGARPKS